MEKLQIKLENCYGIKKLEKEFDFSASRTFAIYAPNGMMKSSFAKTFANVVTGTKPSDLMYANRKSICEIKDENNNEIRPENIFVIKPYDSNFKSQRISTLLASKDLKDRYDIARAKISQFKIILLEKLAELSGLSEEVAEQEMLSVFEKKSFFEFMESEEIQTNNAPVADFSRIKYKNIFSGRVKSLLQDAEFKSEVHGYVLAYNDLITKSKYFKNGFNHYNAESIQKNLKANGFFNAGHSINLLNGEDTTNEIIRNDKALGAIIDNEKKAILKDLSSKWSAIDKKISTEELRDFRGYLSDNPDILAELERPDEFSKKIWLSYLGVSQDLCNTLLSEYRTAKVEIGEILRMADAERTAWHDAIEIFKKRFFVPFSISIENKSDVLLNQQAPAVRFTFSDGADEVKTTEQNLLAILSTGEQKALYILNIIFEVRAREKANQETLFIIDDIADSFDYKNKYAIIQYLKEISNESIFFQIILTHNFDFLRSLRYKFIKYDNCLIALKSADGIKLEKLEGINNIFAKDWMKHLNESSKFIATIPFVRNLIEYTKGDKDPDYEKLSCILHWNSSINTLLVNTLKDIYIRMFPGVVFPDSSEKITDKIFLEAENCLSAAEGPNFENKIVLSIAIRLKAEEFMLKKINNPSYTSTIKTQDLYDEFVTIFPMDRANISILDRVNLTTPENIHLNSFMYEPIIDMSDIELRQLYADVKNL